jgi:Family of unknown function (DUF5906)/Primase C terminal 2 (PriCT-2)
MNTYKFSVSKGLSTNLQSVECDWDKLQRVLTKHVVGNKGEKAFIGGVFDGQGRKLENLIARTFITLDIDYPEMSLDKIEELLIWNVDCRVIAYSTHRSTREAPRIRLIVPLDREVSADEYRVVSRRFADQLGLPVDEASFKPTQLMYYPTCDSLDEAWSYVGIGDEDYPVGEFDVVVTSERGGESDDLKSLESALAAQPLDITDEQVDRALDVYKAELLDYTAWVQVGIALYHQYQGSESGLNRYLHWSSLDSRHDESGNPYFDPRTIRSKWKGFGSNRDSRITFATVLMKASELATTATIGDQTLLEDLLHEASDIETLEDYQTFKTKLLDIDLLTLTVEGRKMIANELANSFGKSKGLTKTDIRQSITPSKGQLVDSAKRSKPEWVKDWCYVETMESFYNTDLGYFIGPNAFNAKFGREPDVVAFEKPPAHVALNEYRIQLAVESMFWPGAERFFMLDGRQIVNTYQLRGTPPFEGEVIDKDGAAVIDLFLAHLNDLIADPTERTIILDWMSYVCRYPGRRVNWAVVLQGDYGNGKTYLGYVFQLVLGKLATIVNGHMFANRFSSWAHGAIVAIVEEIVIKNVDKYETLNMMKPLITNNTIQIEEKGKDSRNVPNFTSYFLLTNHKDAIPVDEGDRRYFVVYSRPFTELAADRIDKFDRLYSESERRADALAWFLLNREISKDFDPRGRAPGTEAKRIMIASSKSDDYLIFQDLLDKYHCEVVCEDMVDITYLKEQVASQAMGTGLRMPNDKRLSSILLNDMGFSYVNGNSNRIKVGGNVHRVYVLGLDRVEAGERLKKFHADVEFSEVTD